jgi:hypothetical protein
MPRILQTDASVWKEATLSFSHTVTPWDSVWTGELDGTLPTFLITDTWKPTFSQCALILWTGPPRNEKNLLDLRTIHHTYQHVSMWDGTITHAVQLLAELLRYKCIYDPESRLPESTIPTTKVPPRPLILITEEEKYSLEKNQYNRFISQILFVKDNPTFSDIFSLCKTLPTSYVVFTRPGIVLDDFRDLWSVSMEKKVLALLSHQVPSSGSLEEDTLPPISDMQDSWIMRSEDAAALEGPQFDIPLSQPKAECAFAYYMLREKFLVVNPARSLVTWTLTRGTLEGPEAEADAPVYHFIHPTGINPMKPLIAIDQDTFHIEQTVEGPDATRWMHTLSKKGIAMTLGKSDLSIKTPKPFLVSKCFQTSTGLAFDSSTMYIGNGRGAQEAWTNIEALVPTVKYDVGTIVPLNTPPIVQIAKLLLSSQGVYTVSEECKSLFRRFGLTASIPLAPRIFFTSALVYPFDSEITPPMIAALRKAVSWSPIPISHDGRPPLICADATFEEALRPAWDVRIIGPQDSFDRILDNLRGAWGMIYDDSLRDFLWMLPLGARVFELSSQDTTAHRVSTVSRLRHIFTTKKKLLDTITDTS